MTRFYSTTQDAFARIQGMLCEYGDHGGPDKLKSDPGCSTRGSRRRRLCRCGANMEIPGFTADFLRSHGLGLDGALQMSFQLAHYKMYGHTASTYESANQSAYKHGRTETVRSATPESDAMCRTFADPGSSRADRELALRAAVRNHGRLTKEALMGGGWDRHMFALRAEARAQGLPEPPIFAGPAYATLSEVILSTSTLSSPNIDGGGFG
eukprot:CAMPEP_0172205528 /NCGR_PEP_ID=MMETSP1050-20130122/32669_1 /TAXON_ID=233186 /ORGANISM="Cryptomonas curvata, Strain CCAP979/52" /LENGTH=209 /DNA_ID=CAMNT_0012884423 /DNA_START=325 /DNA_END=950 /DNA_ORIENTATION=-